MYSIPITSSSSRTSNGTFPEGTRLVTIIMSNGLSIRCDMDENEYVKFCQQLGVNYIGEGGDPLLIRIKDEPTS